MGVDASKCQVSSRPLDSKNITAAIDIEFEIKSNDQSTQLLAGAALICI